MTGIAAGFCIFFRGLVFFHHAGIIIEGISCTRSLEKKLIRQGRNAQVRTDIHITIPHGMEATYEEKSPAFCDIVSGEIKTDKVQEGVHTLSLTYRLIPHYHGTVQCPGGMIQLSDRFFTAEYPLTNISCSGPSLQVQPWPIFELSRTSGVQEFDRFSVEKGFSIRMYREYIPGDDLRHVDWKLSAKRGSLYVREFSSQINNEPLIIIDLPDREIPYDIPRFSQMVGSISGYIESLLSQKMTVSLLFISGANMSDIFYQGSETGRCLALLREELHPRIRTHYLYRRKKRADVRRNIQKLETNAQKGVPGELGSDVLLRIADIQRRYLVFAPVTRFSSDISRMLRAHRFSEIMVYSLCDGDISHLYEISSLAHHQNIPVKLRMPGNTGDSRSRDQRTVHGELIEAI